MATEGDFDSAAERRLDEHLELVRAEPPASDPRLTRGVVRTVRWQRALIVPIRMASAVAVGLVAGVRAVAPTRERRR